MSASPHRLIHASAGTGKTWQLSGRYLELVFRGVEPRRILATTFTRKAAGEIQDRVLRRLAEAASDAQKRAELGAQIHRKLTAADALATLATLTRRLDQMRVRTLDAFFVHVAKLFALELGLPSDWSIVEEAEDRALQREAVARTLERSERLELVNLLRGLQQADASRSVERVLLSEVEAGRNAYLESLPEAWRAIVPAAGCDEAELGAALETLGAAELPRTGKGEPDRSWKKEIAGLIERAQARNWLAFVEKGLGKKILEGETTYQKHEIPEAMLEPLETLARQAVHELVSEVALFNAAALAWLARFEASYEELKSEERAYRFEDLPKALHPREEDRLGERERVWYRLDGRIDHLLLDEFQDTAPVQWRILERLASEILADGTGQRSFFCVGDLKQSIYGWREAEPRLLKELGRRYPVLVPERLSVSHRSAGVILDTVRRTFERIGSNPAFEGHPERRTAAEEFQSDFDVQLPARELPGAAFLLEARGGESEDERALAVLKLAAARARAIAGEAPQATIGILVRRNELIARLIFLLREQGLRASGEGGNPLTDSTAVLHFLSLLQLADHPGDSAAAFHVASSPLAAAVGLTPAGFREQREEVARVTRRRLALEGYGAFAGSFLPAVETAAYGAWDRRRFRQLIDLAHAHEDRAGLRADHFVDHVRATRVEDPSSTQVQVMTVHSAKGLEFDAVILPELDVRFSLRESELLSARPDPAGLLTTVSHARGEAICRLHPLLSELWSERAARELREALCLLYVAMTRAKHRLDLIVQPKKDLARVSHDFAGILRAALGRGPADEHGLLWAHPENAARWCPAPAVEAARAEHAAAPAPRIGPAARVLPHCTPSAAEGDGSVSARDLLRSPRSAARLGGALVHRWLCALEWLEDFRASDAELLALGRGLTHDDELLRAALSEFRGFLGQPALRALLARSSAFDAVWRERPFALVLDEPEGARALWSGAFDRVLLAGRPGSWTRARVIDFKTDRVTAEELDARVEFYRPQLAGYRRVLARMTALAPEAIEARLAFLRLDRVVAL